MTPSVRSPKEKIAQLVSGLRRSVLTTLPEVFVPTSVTCWLTGSTEQLGQILVMVDVKPC